MQKKSKKGLIIAGALLAASAVILTLPRIFARSKTNEIFDTAQLERVSVKDTVYVSGTIKSKLTRNVYAPLSLEIIEVAVSEGDIVRAGDVLARLDTSTLELDLRQAELNLENAINALSDSERANLLSAKSAANSLESLEIDIESAEDTYDDLKDTYDKNLKAAKYALDAAKAAVKAAQKEYDKAVSDCENEVAEATAAGATPEEIADIRAAWQPIIDDAKAALDNAKADRDLKQSQYDAVLETKDNVNKAKDAVDKLELSRSTAKANYENALAKTTSSAVISVELQRIALERRRTDLENATIKAPVDGMVTYVNANVGDKATGLMFVIEDTGALIMETSVGEFDIGSVEVNQRAIVKTDGSGDTEYEAVVSFVGVAAQKSNAGSSATSSDVRFRVELELVEPDSQILIGMNARANITVAEKDGVFAVPYESLTATPDGQDAIYVMTDGKPYLLPVNVGLATDTLIEIYGDGLAEGMLYLKNADLSSGSAMATGPGMFMAARRGG